MSWDSSVQRERITITIPRPMLDSLKDAADAHQRSVGAEVRYAIQLWLARIEQATGAKLPPAA